MHGCMWSRCLFPPTTLSSTELTRCHWLFELLDIWELICWNPTLFETPWVRWSISYSQIQWIDSNCMSFNFFSYVNYCNTRFYYCEWYCKFLSNTHPFHVWFVLFSLYLHSPFTAIIILNYLLEYLNGIQILIWYKSLLRQVSCFFVSIEHQK